MAAACIDDKNYSMKAMSQETSFSSNPANRKILIISTSLPKPDVAAGDVRFFAMLQVLAKTNAVDLLTFEDYNSPESASYKQKLQAIGVNVLRNGKLGLEQAVLQRVYDIVIFEFWRCAAQCMDMIRRQQPQAKVVIDSVDIHFVREEAGLAFGISEPALVSANKQKEIETYQRADLIVVVTPEDREALISVNIRVPQMLVPMIVPIRVREKKQRALELLFVGGFRHPPNVDGLLWFLHECWPAVRAQIPDVKLTVVGSHAPQGIQDLNGKDNIEVAGFVPDTAPYLDKAFLSIAPLRFGAGMKGKVTEAMAAGIPVVTTTYGVQGLNAASGQNIMVGDDPEVFAKHVITLLSDAKLAEEIGLAGQEHIKQLCSVEVVEKQLVEMVSALMRTRVSRPMPIAVLVTLSSRTLLVARLIARYAIKLIKKPAQIMKKAQSPKPIVG